MKLAIIGGRDFNDFNLIINTIDINKWNPVLIISGGANGADTLAERFADKFRIPKKIFRADWNNLEVKPCKIKYNKQGKPYNALAGFNRNKLIVDEADYILAFWNGKSPGTKDSIDYAKEKGKKVLIVKYK